MRVWNFRACISSQCGYLGDAIWIMQLFPGAYLLEVSVGDSYARTSRRRPPVWRRQNIVRLEWNETLTLWPAGPSNSAHFMHQNHKVQAGKLESSRTGYRDEDASRYCCWLFSV